MALKKYKKKLEGALVYPRDLNQSANDYIQFSHFPYKVNDAAKDFGADHNNFRGKYVQLYMPNSTPGTPNSQGWTSQTFPGEVGQLSKQLLAFAGSGGGLSGYGAGLQRGAMLDEVPKQMFLQGVASFVGQDAATALQLGKGQVYNPNVEMKYKMPSLRQFNFNFDFIPKNPSETKVVDSIIREFKQWSSPSTQEGGKFLSVPDLWNLSYHEGGTGATFRRMHKFKYCVLESVKVTENPRSNYHITIDDPDGPAAVHTSMSLVFTQTNIITREDHNKALGEGYQRMY